MAADKDPSADPKDLGNLNPDDQKFVYKKVDNFIVLRTSITLKPDFDFEANDVMVSHTPFFNHYSVWIHYED
jgi:hypothetical protein